jgi:hypothetical protein
MWCRRIGKIWRRLIPEEKKAGCGIYVEEARVIESEGGIVDLEEG